MRIDKGEFPKYQGLPEVVPGHIYLDDKGVEILFLGRGQYWREDEGSGWTAPSDNSFLYMKVEDLDAKIADGRLNEELTIYDPKQASRPDFWCTVFFSKTPRNLMIDRGERYPSTFFNCRNIEDLSGIYYSWGAAGPYLWHIEAYDE